MRSTDDPPAMTEECLPGRGVEKFRQEIRARGNMEDGSVLLKNFLGKEPDMEALYQHIGIHMSQTASGT